MRRAALVAVVSGLAFWANAGPTATAGASETQTISYGGYEIVVPASWPVYRLDLDPHQCVRYDLPALYLGTPGADQQCPPRLLGRTATVSIEIPAGRPAPAGGEMARTVPGLSSVTANPAEHQFALALSGVKVSATYGGDPSVVQRALESLRPVSAAPAPAAKSSPAGTAKGSHAGAAQGFRSTGPTAQWPPAQESAGQWVPAQDPTAQDPTVQDPTVQDPAGQWPTAQDPAAQGPTTQWPPAQGSTAQDPATQDPTTQWPPVQEPATQGPTAQDPATQGPTTQWPSAQEPTVPQSPAPGGTSSRQGDIAAGGHDPAVRLKHAGKPARNARSATGTSRDLRNVTQSNGIAGFDTCTAPSVKAMRAWHRRYGATGIYIGGSNMACDYGNLNASWVRKVTKMGWLLLPVYVGPQAPCYGYGDMIDPKNAASQGQAAAADAASQSAALGLPSDSPIYYDMEGYDETNAGCVSSVLSFLAAWTETLNARGYISGVYSSLDSGVQDLRSAAAKHSVAEPQAIWFAQWDGNRTLAKASTFDPPWPVDARVKQYAGPHWETIGGVTLNIDSDLAGGPPG